MVGVVVVVKGAKKTDSTGWLPLQLAAMHTASAEVVAALLAAHPGAAYERTLAGRTLLDVARSNQAPASVLQILAAHSC